MPLRVFVDIDTQYDFMVPEGRLYVPGAAEIVENLHRLTEYAHQNGIPIIAPACAHTPDDPEFQRFPPHCVIGTPGQRRIEATAHPKAVVLPNRLVPDAVEQFRRCGQVILEKQDFPLFANPNAEAIVQSVGDVEFVAYGVATDYCVRADVLGLLQRGKRVTVVRDAIAALDPRAGQAALEEFERSGARFQTADEVCR